MALILEMKYFYGGTQKTEGASQIRLSIPKSILSTSYEIKEGTIIKGEIMKIYEKEEFGGFRAVQGISLPLKIELILISANIGTDSLYITKESWLKIRDFGFFAEKTLVDVKLESFLDSGKETPIYPKRNVHA
jgi:hypothetical protein